MLRTNTVKDNKFAAVSCYSLSPVHTKRFSH